MLQAARPGLLVLFHNNVIIFGEQNYKTTGPRRHPTLLTDYFKAVASKEEKKKVHQPILFFEEEQKKSLHYKQLIYKDAATDQTLYVALCISVDTWMERWLYMRILFDGLFF